MQILIRGFVGYFAVSLSFFLSVLLFSWMIERGILQPLPGKPDPLDDPPRERELEQKIDRALFVYMQLFHNDCEDTLIMEIARDRVESLRRDLEAVRLRNFESDVTK